MSEFDLDVLTLPTSPNGVINRHVPPRPSEIDMLDETIEKAADLIRSKDAKLVKLKSLAADVEGSDAFTEHDRSVVNDKCEVLMIEIDQYSNDFVATPQICLDHSLFFSSPSRPSGVASVTSILSVHPILTVILGTHVQIF